MNMSAASRITFWVKGLGWISHPGAHVAGNTSSADFPATAGLLPPDQRTPGLDGFVAKWYLSIGAWSAGDWWILLVFALSTILNLAYFLPIIMRAFFPSLRW
jgi:hypothetical protein